MQTTALPIQLNTNSPAQAQRNGASAGSDGAQFGAMLSSEMELRQPAPAPAPAPKAETPKPQAADKPAQPDGADAPQQAAKPEPASKPADAGKAAEASDSDSADKQDGKDEAQSGQAGDPANAMLALMASLQQPARDAKDTATSATAQAFDALGGAAGKGKRGDAAQLAALQAAMKSVAKDGSGIATTAGKAFSDSAALNNPALAATGAALGADDKAADAGARLGADLRAALAAGNGAAGKGGAEAQLGPDELSAELSLRQARETAVREPVAAAAALAQAQPAVMEAVQAASGAADRLSARVGTDAWEHQVGQKIVYMAGSEEQTASLTLNPPDLGPLQVVLSVSNDQASVTFSANQEEVRQALENALPRLREMMSESGIALGNATVNAGMPDGRQAQEQAAHHGGGFGNNGRGRGESGNAAEDMAARPLTRTAIIGERGMVDTFA
ncbi:MAG: flagellar hook-length control protein FliK [Ramlibacter sp.]